MTIQYKIGATTVLPSSCYGSINSHIPGVLHMGVANEWVDKEFDGITLLLSYRPVAGDVRPSTLFLDTNDEEYHRTMLRIARAVGFQGIVPATYQQVKRDKLIHFPKTLPFFAVVAATGFFRAFSGSNHTTLHKVYDKLRNRGLDPYEAFVAANSIKISYDDKVVFYPNGEHSVIPWNMCNKESLAKFRTWRERMPSLPSMEDELLEARQVDEYGYGLHYFGRDEWFGAHEAWDEIDTYDYEDYMDYSDRCVTLKHVEGGVRDYADNVVNLDTLIEEIKSWR